MHYILHQTINFPYKESETGGELRQFVKAVVDLGAAPGGWSQVVAAKLGWLHDTTFQEEPAHDARAIEEEEDYPERKEERWRRRDCLHSSTIQEDPVHDARAIEEEEEEYPERTEERRRPSNSRKNKRKQKVEVEDEEPYDPLNIDDLEPSSALTGRGTIVAVDLLKMQPIHGVHAIQADFLAAETERRIHNLLSVKGNLECKADIILSDIAANASGNDVHDIESSLEICEAVFCFARQYLRSAERIGRRRGGVLLMKHFEHPLLQKFRVEKLLPNFHDVRYIKPDSSRSASREGYFLCQGWKALEE